jgi:hypothetical protein
MPAPGITVIAQRPPAPVSAMRADVAVFAGLVRLRAGAPDATLRARLAADGWHAGGVFAVSAARLDGLLAVPVAVESWSDFDAVFDWQGRETMPGARDNLPSPLGLAVRAFFREGGAKAWILRCGDPLSLTDPALDDATFAKRQLTALAGPIADPAKSCPILPGFRARALAAEPQNPATWTGASAIYAIDDAAMLLLPDLPDLVSGPAQPLPEPDPPPGPPEQFIPCAPAVTADAPDPRDGRPHLTAPRLDAVAYRAWADAFAYVLQLLGRPRGPAHRRDVMVVGGLPIPDTGGGLSHGAEQWPLDVLMTSAGPGQPAPFDVTLVGSGRIQLGYPWLGTADSATCPEGLQSPEGALAGVIAAGTRALGGFRGMAGRRLATSVRLVPEIAGSDIARPLTGQAEWLGDRLCLFAEKRGRIELISDATCAQDRAWRKGGTSRLIGILLRAAKQLGEDYLFEPGGPALWNRITGRVTAILEQLRGLGAFSGQTPAECYRVICGPGSMTQAEIDAGRVICEVIVNPASPIERIVVTLALIEPLPAGLAAPALQGAA